MTLDDAREAVLRDINRRFNGDEELALLEGRTIERPYGWVFFYNTKRCVETGNPMYGLAGNGPVVFELGSGEITHLSSAEPPEAVIRRFEEARGRNLAIDTLHVPVSPPAGKTDASGAP